MAEKSKSFKEVVIGECTRIHNDYIEKQKEKGSDTHLLECLNRKGKTLGSCINHIMNNLVEKRIYGGADSLMYEYIHEYYVDDFEEVEDKWSNHTVQATPQPVELTDEQKKEALERAIKRFEEEQVRKLEEEKRAKKEAKAREAAKKQQGVFEEISIFDL